MSPTARRKNDAASTAMAMPFAARALAVSCAATAATAAKAAPAPDHERPKAQAPRVSSPPAIRPRAVSRPSRRLAPRVRMSVASSGACRPTHRGAR